MKSGTEILRPVRLENFDARGRRLIELVEQTGCRVMEDADGKIKIVPMAATVH